MIILHFLLGILYITIPLIGVVYYRTYYIENTIDKSLFLSGFFLKIFGALSAAAIYTYYYDGGDTTYYFHSGEKILDYILEYPKAIGDIFFSKNLSQYNEIDFYPYKYGITYYKDTSSYTVTKISILLNFITFRSFILSSILCSYFSFYCSWKFYKFIIEKTKTNRSYIGYAIFFMPSAIFWGSGLFKDTFTLAGLYLFVISIVNFFGYKKYKIIYILYLVIGFYLLFNIRSFFLLSIFPFIAIWILYFNYKKINSPTIKFFLIPIFIVFILGSTLLIFQSLTQNFQELSIENLTDKSKGFQSWHTTLKGSAYSLGNINYTIVGILSKVPASINVTFFRPYLWEADKPIIFIAAIQSFFFLIFTCIILFKTKIIYFLPALLKSPPAIALFGFSLFYAFVVGFTSYNFGALDRYKIPCLSTYILALLFVYESYLHSSKTN